MRRLWLWLAAFVLFVYAWQALHRSLGESGGRQALAWILVIVAHMSVALALHASLAPRAGNGARACRLSFFGSLGLGLAAGAAVLASPVAFPAWKALLAWVGTWLGAFAGGLLATTRHGRLWEDNFPPAPAILQEVRQRHTAHLRGRLRLPLSKRLFDLAVASLGLLFSLPVWLAAIFAIWIEDPGPLLFVKNSVGLGGRNFRQFKLRTMVCGAEEATGPVLAQRQDERVLATGRLLRKTALDELPQLVNILKGEMSVVGPRPQRTVLVHQYLKELPEYAERHQVRPGLAGLAQVAGSYYLTPRQKLRFDRLYLRHISLGFDLRLLLGAFLIAFVFRWKKGWDGRLPRWLLH